MSEERATYAAERAAATAPTDDELIAFVREHGPSLRQLCEAFGYPAGSRTIRNQLQRLRKQGRTQWRGAILKAEGQRWYVEDV